MLSSVLFALLVCRTVQSQEKDFYVYHSFQALASSSIIKVLKVQEQLKCAFSCSSFSGCRSFNFAQKKDKGGKHLCQLLPNEKESNTLEASEVFHYYEKFNPDPCGSHPCQNGGKCDVMAGARDFSCTCAPEFTGKYCELDNWTKINTNPICFGARGDNYSSFSIQRTGVCIKIKLVKRWGFLTCNMSDPNGKGNWGCVEKGKHAFLSVVITDDSNKVLLPGKDAFLSVGFPIRHVYNLRGVTATDNELVYPKLPGLFPVTTGQVYRVWFGQDLDDILESDNYGTLCADVYCLYQ